MKKLVNAFVAINGVVAIVSAVFMYSDHYYKTAAPILAASIAVLMVYLIGEASKND